MSVTPSDREHTERRSQPVVAQSFPRRARLTRPSEFSYVFKRPIASSDRCFRVLARPARAAATDRLDERLGRGVGELTGEWAGEVAHARLGMAVSRQVDRRAVGRNRIKRVVRESFRRRFAGRGPAVDIVVLPRRTCATISNTQLFESLESHWAFIVAQLETTSRCP